MINSSDVWNLKRRVGACPPIKNDDLSEAVEKLLRLNAEPQTSEMVLLRFLTILVLARDKMHRRFAFLVSHHPSSTMMSWCVL